MQKHKNTVGFKASTALSVILASSIATSALAQDIQEQENVVKAGTADGDSVIVVSGYRDSLNAARTIKRDSAQFVDAVVADDIGKLPDTNVAESLARVSGVQVERGIGEGSDISVRGLRQNVILYNGRQIVDATGRGGNGLDQLGTSTFGLLSLVPSELISRLEVTKLAGADQIAGALGGIVDIHSRHPLSGQAGLQVVANASVTYDELAGKEGYELFGLLSNSFADDTLGILLSASYSQRDLAEQGLNTFSGFGVIADNSAPLFDAQGNPVSNDPNGDGVSGTFHLDPRLQQISEQRDRLGISGVIQWQPSDDFELTADTFYSKLTSDRDRHWIGYFAGFGPHRNVAFSPDEVLLSGTVRRPIQTNVEFADIEAKIWSSALRSKFSLSDNFHGSAEISYGKSESTFDQLFFRLQSRTATDITYDFTQGLFGSFSFPADLTDPDALNLAILFDNTFRSETDDLAVRLDLDWEFDSNFLRSFETGIRYNSLETANSQLNVDIRPNIPADTLGNIIGLFSNDDFLPGTLAGLPRTFLSAEKSAFTGCESLNALFTAAEQASCSNPLSNQGSLLNSFVIEEDLTDIYGKLNFGSGSGDVVLSGNIGLRYVNRKMISRGNQLFGGVVSPNIFTRSDSEWLPSLVAKAAIGDDLIIRVGGARVVAFPNTEDLNNGLQLFGDFRGQGGSPNLDPFLANQIDASVEYYFADDALISAGLFYKDIKTFIVQQSQQEVIPGFAQPFSINRKINGDSADVKGIELLYQQPFTFLPAPFDGLGVITTYSYIDSSTPITDNAGRNLPLPGLSKHNVNLVAYFEQGRFGARVAYNWRDRYLLSIGPANTGIFNDNFADLSASMRYDFTENFSLNIEAANLTNSKQRTFNAVSEALRTNVVYGRIFKATVSAKF